MCSDGVTRFSVTATGIGVTIAVAATVLLVVGSEMSVQNGKFASLSMLKLGVITKYSILQLIFNTIFMCLPSTFTF